MNIQIQSVNFHSSNQLQSFVSEKVNKLNRYNPTIINSDVYLKLESHQKIKDKVAEIKVHVPGAVLFASEKSKSFEQAVDMASHSLERQLKKIKKHVA